MKNIDVLWNITKAVMTVLLFESSYESFSYILKGSPTSWVLSSLVALAWLLACYKYEK